MPKYVMSFDLDEGWEQALPMECSSLEEAKVAAIENLYEFNDMLDDDFNFTIYEVKETHQCSIEDIAGKWDSLVKASQAKMKAYYEKRDREEFERLKKKLGD